MNDIKPGVEWTVADRQILGEMEAGTITDPALREAVAGKLRGIQDALTALSAELHAAMQMMAQCDGSRDGEPCILSWHSGQHRSATGFEWLDA